MQWDRRRFIKAAGITGAAAAVLRYLPRALAAGEATAPRRLLLIRTGNGTLLPRWRSNGSGSPFVDGQALPELHGPILEPLDAHRNRLLLLDGIDQAATISDSGGPVGPNKGHSAATVLWTGHNADTSRVYWNLEKAGQKYLPKGPSVDQELASRIRGSSAFSSFHLITWRQGDWNPEHVDSFKKVGEQLEPNLATEQPHIAYDALFGTYTPADSSSDGEPVEYTVNASDAGQRHVLGMLRGEFQRLRRELGGDDRYRLDEHLRNMIALENTIGSDTSSGSLASCDPHEPSEFITGNQWRGGGTPQDQILTDERVDAHTTLIAEAFACDRTRVINYCLAPEGTFDPSIGSISGDVHRRSHEMDGEPADSTDTVTEAERTGALDTIASYQRWCASKIKTLLDKLDARSEDNGRSVLDNTTIVWATAMSYGGLHLNLSTPYVVVPAADSGFVRNRYLRYSDWNPGERIDSYGGTPGEANNRLLVSLCRDFGHNVDTFGDTRFAGPLPRIAG